MCQCRLKSSAHIIIGKKNRKIIGPGLIHIYESSCSGALNVWTSKNGEGVIRSIIWDIYRKNIPNSWFSNVAGWIWVVQSSPKSNSRPQVVFGLGWGLRLACLATWHLHKMEKKIQNSNCLCGRDFVLKNEKSQICNLEGACTVKL